MLINDLPFLENVAEHCSIVGSAGAIVTADATASGSSPIAIVHTTVKTRELPDDGSLAIGFGFAWARGDNPTADVTVTGTGEIVIDKTRSVSKKHFKMERGIVIAIDLPAHY